MMNAYHEMYLRSAMTNLANMFDFAISDFGLGRDDFVSMFLSSMTCRRLENAEPKYLTGMCGEELAMRVIEETTGVTPVGEIEERYYRTMHEADISRFADVMDSRREMLSEETNLKRIRTAYGCSQSELARMSGVSLRSIQMYEQRNKDINKGQSVTVMSLSRALGCRMEELLERA